MLILLFLTLIFGAVALMSYQLISFGTPLSIVIAILQGLTVIVSFIMTVRMFRGQRGNYKAGFYAIGALIASSVPALVHFLFGILFMITALPAFLYIGWTLAALVFLGIINGIVRGRWNWKVRTVELAFDNLPSELDGLKVVQFSDAHIGSFFNQYARVQKAIDRMNALEPDYILFTGDLVNNLASEMKGWEPVFSQLQAKHGKYSILGNHDYADYMRWENKSAKDENLRELIAIHRAIGFTPLLNESVEISGQENKAFIIGVENWERAASGNPAT